MPTVTGAGVICYNSVERRPCFWPQSGWYRGKDNLVPEQVPTCSGICSEQEKTKRRTHYV